MELRGPILWVLSRTPLSFFFSTAIEVERSEPSVEPSTIIPKGLGIILGWFINPKYIQIIYRHSLSVATKVK